MKVFEEDFRVIPFVIQKPWQAVGIAFAAGALLATDIPGRKLILRVVRLLAVREARMALLGG